MVGLAMPGITLVLIHMVNIADRIRVYYVECQVNDAVATCLVEREIIVTCFGQRTVAISETATLTDRFLDIGIGDVLNGQIQNMLNAIVAVLIFQRFEVTPCLSVG